MSTVDYVCTAHAHACGVLYYWCTNTCQNFAFAELLCLQLDLLCASPEPTMQCWRGPLRSSITKQLASLALQAAGIGPWLNETRELVAPGTYCGNNITVQASIQLTQNYGTYPENGTYWEIFRFLGGDKSFFSDLYDARCSDLYDGPSLFYVGMTTKRGYSYADLADFLQANGIYPNHFFFHCSNQAWSHRLDKAWIHLCWGCGGSGWHVR